MRDGVHVGEEVTDGGHVCAQLGGHGCVAARGAAGANSETAGVDEGSGAVGGR